MAHLIIKNLGPISFVEMDIKSMTILIGPQSSGKSTIAKVVSFCKWIEKEAVINPNVEKLSSQSFFNENLIEFHRLQSAFIKGNVFIDYDSDLIRLSYSKDGGYQLELKAAVDEASSRKVAYIPAERNLVFLDNLQKLELPRVNTRSFIFDWISLHGRFTQEQSLPILNLGLKYYYDINKGERLKLNETEDIAMTEASSGLQSLVPIMAFLYYMLEWVFDNEDDISYEKKHQLEMTFMKRYMRLYQPERNLETENLEEYVARLGDEGNGSLTRLLRKLDAKIESFSPEESEVKKIYDYRQSLWKIHSSDVILEEPELNLFPLTQLDFVYDLLTRFDANKHSVFMTTHSPYILYALNNCVLAGVTRERWINENTDHLAHVVKAAIAPELVSVYKMTIDGTTCLPTGGCESIQDHEGLIRKNYFDQVMRSVMVDYNNLLNYYDRH